MFAAPSPNELSRQYSWKNNSVIRNKIPGTETGKVWGQDLPEDPRDRNILLFACCSCNKPMGCA